MELINKMESCGNDTMFVDNTVVKMEVTKCGCVFKCLFEFERY